MAIQEITSPPMLDSTGQAMVTKLQSIASAINSNAGAISYDNTISGMTATKVQSAIDEVKGITDTISSSLTNLDTKVDYKVTADRTTFRMYRIFDTGTYRLKSQGRWNAILCFGTYNATNILNYITIGSTTDTKIYGNTQITRSAVSGDNYSTDITIPASTDMTIIGDITSLTKL